jgi:hypothetical protein
MPRPPQCQAIAKSTQKQCKRSAQVNGYCQQHYDIIFPEGSDNETDELQTCTATKLDGNPCNHPVTCGDYCGYHDTMMKRKKRIEREKVLVKNEVVEKPLNHGTIIKILKHQLKNMILKEDANGNATVELHFESVDARNIFEAIKGLTN